MPPSSAWFRLLAVPLGVALVSACQFPGYSFEPGSGGSAGGGGIESSAGAPSDGGLASAPSAGGAGSQSCAGAGSGGDVTAGSGGEATDDGAAGAADEPSAGGSAGTSGTPPVGCTGEADFCDDFEDVVADGWSTSGGTWAVLEDVDSYAFQGGGASEEALAGEASWADQIVEARVRVVSFGGASDTYRAGIVARYASSSAYYVFAIGGDKSLTIRRSTGAPGGSSGSCAAVSTSIEPAEWFTLRLEVTGPSGNVRLRTYLNGSAVHDCTTTETTTANGRVGVLTVGSGSVARFDDVKVLLP